jgi:hypothetical protein
MDTKTVLVISICVIGLLGVFVSVQESENPIIPIAIAAIITISGYAYLKEREELIDGKATR